MLSGAATCSEGFVTYFLTLPKAVGLYCSSQKAYYNTFGTSSCPRLYNTLRVYPIPEHLATFQEDVAKSELHELLLNYIRVRSALIGAERRVTALAHDVEANKESVWTMRDDKVEESGECADEKEVTAVLQFKVLQPNE